MIKLTTTAAIFAALITACGSGAPKGDTTNNTTGTGSIDAGPAAPPEPEGLGMASDATVLDNGAQVQLASAWINSHAVIVFYRGHW